MADTRLEVRHVRHGDANIRYAVAGPTDPKARTICLIASTGRGAEDFYHLAEPLAAGGLRVVAPWPRGMGGSEGPLEELDFHDLAGDAAAALRAEATEGGAIVAGHAYGCWIARTVAQDFPQMVDGLIMLAAGAGQWPQALSDAIDTAMDPEAPEADRLAALRMAFFTESADPRPWLNGWSAKVVRAQRAARKRTSRDSWWPSGRAPMLDIVGLQDPFRAEPDRDFYLRAFAPRLRLELVDGASHALPDEKPAEVARLMLNWISALKPDRTPVQSSPTS